MEADQSGIGILLDSKKVSDHHAIIPTVEIETQDMGRLSEGERKILAMVANRLLCAVAKKHLYKKVYILLNCNEYPFEATGTKMIEPGFKRYEDLLKEMFGIKTEAGGKQSGSEDTEAEQDTGGRAETFLHRHAYGIFPSEDGRGPRNE